MFSKEVRREIEDIAEEYGWNPYSLLAIVEVESNGKSSWRVGGEQMPAIRFEGHYFYKRLKGAKLKRAVAEGLAHPKSGRVKNPRGYKARYDLLARAKRIDRKAALESTSVGLGQVMGAWWDELEYESVEAMFARAEESVAGQVELMARYIDKFGLGHLVTGKPSLKTFTRFAERYNGKGFRRNKYHTKMWASYKRWSNGAVASPTADAEREFIRDAQKDLATLGYEVGDADGIAGRKTKAAVRKFQSDNGLVVDGIIGPMVREELDDELAEKNDKAGDTALARGTAVTAPTVGAASIGETILGKVTDLQSLGVGGTIFEVVIGGLALVGISFLCYGFYKKYKGRA